MESGEDTFASVRRRFDVTGLFGGVGGLELGLGAAGHFASAFCESDPEAATILARSFSSAALTRDVRETDEVLASISPKSDLLTAGFPCSDLSQAGLVRGFAGERSSLVRDVFKLLHVRRFPHVVLENVPNWRFLHRGDYLREVVGSLEELGYRWAYRTVDALAFGAPQRRLRIFLYATLDGDPRDVLFEGDVSPDTREWSIHERAHGFYWTEGNRGLGWGEDCVPTLKGGSTVGVPSPPAILMPSENGRPGRLITPDIRDAERLQGLDSGWTAAERTIDGEAFRDRRRWMLVGNAVSVRAATWLGERLAVPTPTNRAMGRRLSAEDGWPVAAWCDGEARYSVEAGAWPIAVPREPLADFLRYPGAPLSKRAASGFLSRYEAGSLRRKPDLVAVLRNHLALPEVDFRPGRAA